MAGLIGFDAVRAVNDCHAVLGRMQALGPDQTTVRQLGPATLGYAQYRLLPEDQFDAQPLIGGGGTLLLSATARLDNREELGSAFGFRFGELAEISNCALLLAAWERWQLACVDRLVGDYSFAVWNDSEGQLTLVRGPLALKTLFFHHSPRGIAFATLPGALFVLPAMEKRLNRDEAARLAAGVHWSDETLFAGVHKVEHGHAVILDRSGWRSQRIWNLNAGSPPKTP